MLDMGIIKVEVNLAELKDALQNLAKRRTALFEAISGEIKQATSFALNELMSAEMAVFLGKPEESDNKRNGYKLKSYVFKGIGGIQLRVPKDRKNKFESHVVPKSEQIDPRLKEDIAVLHLAGISKRTMEMISRRILGVDISRQTVSNALQLIEGKATAWLTRPLTKPYWALYIDGTHFKIQRRQSTEAEPSLVVLGIGEDDKRSILAIEPGLKDNAETWRSVFESLKERGLDPSRVRIGIMDGLPGLETAFKEAFPNAVTARCWVHALKNAMAKVPERLQEPFRQLASRIMYADSENGARASFSELKKAMESDAQRAVQCLAKDIDSLLTHYKFEKRYWVALKTTNPIERINKEFKRRAKTMESMGESTRECLLAFTALRLEMGWRLHPVDHIGLDNVGKIKHKPNPIEDSLRTLLN